MDACELLRHRQKENCSMEPSYSTDRAHQRKRKRQVNSSHVTRALNLQTSNEIDGEINPEDAANRDSKIVRHDNSTSILFMPLSTLHACHQERSTQVRKERHKHPLSWKDINETSKKVPDAVSSNSLSYVNSWRKDEEQDDKRNSILNTQNDTQGVHNSQQLQACNNSIDVRCPAETDESVATSKQGDRDKEKKHLTLLQHSDAINVFQERSPQQQYEAHGQFFFWCDQNEEEIFRISRDDCVEETHDDFEEYIIPRKLIRRRNVLRERKLKCQDLR
mmetsp:Transcript_35654/g.42965  ORF Transcript_35654/g.42965 Transcript_35654/m.42965 type:complete len:277 (+) Transcript_35654:30-860(+)